MSVLDRWLKPGAEKSDPAISAPLTEQSPATSATNVANCSKRVATSNPLALQGGFGVVADVADVARFADPRVRAHAREGEDGCDPSEGLDSEDRAEGQLISPVRWAEPAMASDDPSFEEPCPERRGLIERREAVFLHFCVECGRWGAYGYDTTRNHPGRWYCRLHRPE